MLLTIVPNFFPLSQISILFFKQQIVHPGIIIMLNFLVSIYYCGKDIFYNDAAALLEQANVNIVEHTFKLYWLVFQENIIFQVS